MLPSGHNLVGKFVHKYVFDSLEFNLSVDDLKFGCMKPDFYPKFVTIPHYKDKSFSKISGKILSLQNTKFPESLYDLRAFSSELGIILHYITDYFCYPHNDKSLGRMPYHLIYEIKLNKELKKFISNPSKELDMNLNFEDWGNMRKSIIYFIEEKHRQYMEEKPCISKDVIYGLEACSVVAAGIVVASALKNISKAA